MATENEVLAMRLAIVLSANGLATASPNPPVGCVILDAAGSIVGTGYHRRKGEPHAERYALGEAEGRAKGGTAVVTLEPCNHVGRTPACHQGLLDAEISRVVVALIDPTSRREGGVALLREAGVDVEVGVLAEEARVVIGPWLEAFSKGRPIVTAVHIGGTASTSLVQDEHPAFDAVVLTSGDVVEGIPGGHGPGAFTLPLIDIDSSPQEAILALYAGGARSVLVEADGARVERLRAAGCLDKVVFFEAPDQSVALPSGLRISRAEMRAEFVRLELVPVQ